MNNNWNVNNRGRKNWNEPWRGGRGRGGNRGSWPRNNYCDQQMPYPNQRGGFRGNNRNNFRGKNPNQRQWQSKPYRENPGKRLSEEDIGVTEYMSDHKGFNGIIKCRYSDFQVSEINEKGETAKLTDTSPPEPPPEETINEDEDLLLTKYNLEIIPMDKWDKLNELVVNPEAINDVVEVDVTGMSKEERTKIHDAVKKAFGASLIGSTVTENDKKFVKFVKYKKGVCRDTRVKWVWPAEYVYFIVHKENCDTMEAAARIAERLRLNIKPSMLGYAGTKDRRAKTSQWFSLRKVDPRRISTAAKDMRDVHVGNFSFSPINLKLGMLKGNLFRIALRNVTASEEVVAAACNRLKEDGFINYYGLQRFGARPDVPTYQVGRLLLQSNYKQAIAHIVDDEEMVRPVGGRGSGGARLKRALQNNPNDLLGALDQLARNQRVLYLHAYQSLVWNRCASERLRRLGRNPAAGDLVPLDASQISQIENEQDSENEDKDENTSEDNMADSESKPDSKEMKSKKEVQTKNVPKPKVIVKALTEEDIESGFYTIFDIVLPVPGYNIEYPPNMVDYYKELLEKDNLKLDMRHKNKAFSLCGAYRSMCARAGELQWRLVQYKDPNADLLLSDLQLLQGMTDQDTGVVPDGPYKALLLTLSLPSSSYATMALRELMKVDTANDSQASQNDYHKRGAGDIKRRDGKGAGDKSAEEAGDKSGKGPEDKSGKGPEDIKEEDDNGAGDIEGEDDKLAGDKSVEEAGDEADNEAGDNSAEGAEGMKGEGEEDKEGDAVKMEEEESGRGEKRGLEPEKQEAKKARQENDGE